MICIRFSSLTVMFFYSFIVLISNRCNNRDEKNNYEKFHMDLEERRYGKKNVCFDF